MNHLSDAHCDANHVYVQAYYTLFFYSSFILKEYVLAKNHFRNSKSKSFKKLSFVCGCKTKHSLNFRGDVQPVLFILDFCF